jgi:Domain of unknown function (DUF4382)
MRRAGLSPEAIPTSPIAFCALLFLATGLMGCDSACFVFVSNPGGGAISAGSSSCSLKPATGEVRLKMGSPVSQPTQDQPGRIRHIFVTFAGIEATANSANEPTAEWRELAPKLVTQPMQWDLLSGNAQSCASDTFDGVAVPVDAYRQVRLRVLPNQSDKSGNAILQENSCGTVGLHCIVTSDGDIRPLAVDSNSSQIQISSDHITGGFFQILPDTTANLRIEFNPQKSVLIPDGEVVELVPVFTVDQQAPCDSIGSSGLFD